MSFFNILDKLNPPRTLTLNLKSPEEKQVILTRNRQGEIQLSNAGDKLYQLKDVAMHLSENDKRSISNGAIAGAFAASMMDKDVLTGAIIGDWWEKQNDDQSRQVDINLIEIGTGELRRISLRLKRQQYQQIRRFFNLI